MQCHDVGSLFHVGLPAGCRKALEAMSAELNGANPSFTIRRNIQQALDDQVLVDELRKVDDHTSSLIDCCNNWSTFTNLASCFLVNSSVDGYSLTLNYLCQGGYVLPAVCPFVRLSVCPARLTSSHANY